MNRTILYSLLISALLFSCKKEAGEGGKLTISGKVKQLNIDENDSLINEEYLVDEEVFIIYGNDQLPNNSVKTSSNGSFEFKYLYPGNYIIYILGDDTSGTDISGKSAYQIEIELSKTDDIKDIGDLLTYNNLKYNDGFATISGKAYQINYFKGTSVVKDTSYAQDQEVYLIYNNHTAYDKRIRTNYDGSFTFTNLIKGDYTIFMYSDDLSGATQQIAEKTNISVTTDFQTSSISNIYIKRY